MGPITIPTSTPPGEYLLRIEHIGLHEGHVGKAQFYMECAQLKIVGGAEGGTGSNPVKIPGLYKASDPGIAFNKWNNPRSYVMPGPALSTFSGGGSSGGGSQPAPGSGAEEVPETGGGSTPPSNGGGSGSVGMWGQCGGTGYTGPTTCSKGSCKVLNPWYSQCL